jgi:SAM-dependent methyltransferase
VVDVGCADGVMFSRWTDLIGQGYGVDPILDMKVEHPRWTLYPGYFPDALPPLNCDVITMLAVLEHIPGDQQAQLSDVCHRLLNPRGRIVITVPSPRVDDVLRFLSFAHLIDGMSIDEHYGFEVERTVEIFAEPQFRLIHRHPFQAGLNNLFVFERS